MISRRKNKAAPSHLDGRQTQNIHVSSVRMVMTSCIRTWCSFRDVHALSAVSFDLMYKDGLLLARDVRTTTPDVISVPQILR